MVRAPSASASAEESLDGCEREDPTSFTLRNDHLVQVAELPAGRHERLPGAVEPGPRSDLDFDVPLLPNLEARSPRRSMAWRCWMKATVSAKISAGIDMASGDFTVNVRSATHQKALQL
jgi:hypothetical protein